MRGEQIESAPSPPAPAPSATELISQAHPAASAHTGTAPCSLTPKAVSADGQWALFHSAENTLFDDDTNWMADLFLRDLVAGVTRPIVTAAYNVNDPTELMPDLYPLSRDAVLSGNGRYVAFVRGGRNGTFYSRTAIMRFDRLTGELAPVNLSWSPTNSGVLAPWDHAAPDLSADGNLVAWQGVAVDLVADPPAVRQAYTAIYLRDMVAGTNQLISINLATNDNGNNGSIKPRLSPDTRRVVFQSSATDLAPGVTSSTYYKLFTRDLPMQTTRLMSVDDTGATIENESSDGAAFSGDGRYMAFHTTGTARIFRHDFASQANTNVLVTTNGLNPSLTFDGRLIAYQTRRGSNAINDVVVRDLQTGINELISVNRSGTGGGNGHSFAPQISAYGRYVVFASRASDLVDHDSNHYTDVFVRDRWQTNTLLLSVARDGFSGNAVSGNPVLSADGRTVIFESFSSDLSDGDYNDKRDLFVVRLGLPDSDGDGMDDDWEMTYFSTLNLDGTGDFDADGASDLHEFQAGTDPTNLGSVLRVLMITATSGGPTTLLWRAIPGRTYGVQFKDGVDGPAWSGLGSGMRAVFNSATFTDTNAAPARRFYRVMVEP